MADDITRIGRAAGKIDQAGIGGMLAHPPQNKGAVGGAERAHAKTVVHRGVGEIPIAPSDKACEIGVEIGAAKNPARDREAMQQQHAAVPQLRLVALQLREVFVDAGTPLQREWPSGRRKGELEPLDGDDLNVARRRPEAPRHASIVPSLTTTASPPIEAAKSFPPCSVMPSR